MCRRAVALATYTPTCQRTTREARALAFPMTEIARAVGEHGHEPPVSIRAAHSTACVTGEEVTASAEAAAPMAKTTMAPVTR